MNREQMKRGYDSMTPDHAARQRMLQRIMEQGGQTMNNEYSAQPQKKPRQETKFPGAGAAGY